MAYHTLFNLAVAAVLLVSPWAITQAQQPPDCTVCSCVVPPGMTGITYSNATSHVCPQNNLYNMNVGRFLRFYAIIGNVYTFSLCGETANTSMYITNTTGTVVMACDDDGCGTPNGPSVLSFVPSITGTYRLYVFNGSCPNTFPEGTLMNVNINCAAVQVPPNNVPCDATVLPSSSSACNYISSTNLAATNSGLPMPPVCNGLNSQYQGADVWFRTVIPADGLLGIQTQEGDICAGMFQLYTSNNGQCNGTLSPVPDGCSAVGLTGPNSEPALIFDATLAGIAPGTTVWIRYWERGGNENGSFQICAYDAIRPVNDDPCDALALPLNTTCVPSTYTFANASPSTVPVPGCGNTANMHDIWFSFQVPFPLPGNWSGISVNTTANNPLDLAMAWYRMTPPPCSPGSLTQIACNPSGSINSAAVNPNLLIAGETIYVRIWRETPWIGTYDICAVLNQAPVNDEPCGAIALDLNYGCLMQSFSNSSATPSIIGGITNAPCGGGIANNDVWFTVTVPPNGVVQLDMQSGGLTNAGMAVYTAASCTNLNTPPIACANNGSQQGPGSANMPYLNLTNQTPGATLYIRVWRQGANTDGSFGICARRTDIPPGNCFYTLNMFDSAGDGWGGSYVTICVAGNCTNYTVTGSQASVNIGVNIGQTFTVSYTSAGGFENQNSYSITQFNSTIFSTNPPPQTGLVYSQTVNCAPPPSPQSDCYGAMVLCNQTTLFNQQPVPGTQELNSSNQGCLLYGEHWGLWYMFQVATPGYIAFTIAPTVIMDFDFAVWGPYPPSSTLAGNCPVAQLPLRCNWAPTYGGNTGLAVNPTTPTYSPAIYANAGDVFILYVDQWTQGPDYQFNLIWDTGPGSATFECIILPVSMLSLGAYESGGDAIVEWSTATEQNSAWFDVERSSDGERFTTVGRVAAAGTTNTTNRYQFVDDEPLEGLAYYRLKQVDINGGFAYSETVSVLIRGQGALQVFPNPTADVLYVSMVEENEEILAWRITDMSGRMVQTGTFATNVGRNLQEIAVQRLEQGSYLLEIRTLDGLISGNARFIKQ